MRKMLAAAAICMLVLTGCGDAAPKNTVNSLEDLKGKAIGVQLKTTGDIYASDIEDAEVKRFNKGRDAVAALCDGVVDAVMLDDAPAEVFVEEFGTVRILEESYAEESYGIAVRKDNQELLDKLNKALEELKADGTIDKIETAWLQGGETTSAYEREQKASYSNGVLLVATNAEFPPYESFTEEGEIVGIDVDIMKAVCDRLDMDLQMENTAFDALIGSVERGAVDAVIAAMTVTEERLERVNFTDTYMDAKQVIIVRKDK